MTRRTPTRRKGAGSLVGLMTLPALLLLVGLVFYVAHLRGTRDEAQNGSDAAALAAAMAFVCDDFLSGKAVRCEECLVRSRIAADNLTRANFAGGEQLSLQENDKNDPEGDIVFGFLDQPFGEFAPAMHGTEGWCVGVNAVRVSVHRSPVKGMFGGKGLKRELRSQATAMLDYQVIGFRPKDDTTPFPMVPIALFTDHMGKVQNTWDGHCYASRLDEHAYDPKLKQFVLGKDDIPEVTVVLGKQPEDSSAVPATFLQVGAKSFADTAEQIRSGILRTHLTDNFAGEFVLGDDNTLGVNGSPQCPEPNHPNRDLLNNVLAEAIADGKPRLWPLFASLDEERGLILLSGWVGARLISASESELGGVKLVLQPTMVADPATVTTHNRIQCPAFWSLNNTVCRVRLAE